MALYTREQILLSKSNDFICKRDALMDTPGLTLDGRPSYIGGRLNRYGVVWCPGGDDLHQAKFAWSTIEHVIMNKGGAFTS